MPESVNMTPQIETTAVVGQMALHVCMYIFVRCTRDICVCLPFGQNMCGYTETN